jgi:hypothetical protein
MISEGVLSVEKCYNTNELEKEIPSFRKILSAKNATGFHGSKTFSEKK